jgi:hypothetical protein
MLIQSRDELLAAVGRDDIHLFVRIALISIVQQKDIADALSGWS